MARCNCSSVKCACVIRQGTGATVTGSGRAEDPYVISADGGGGGGSGFESGDVKWTARPTPPSGWLVANGDQVSRATYADLFAAIGTTYGSGDGSTTFTLPDLTGRFLLGADGGHEQGSRGGSEEKTLGLTNLPAHAHSTAHDHPAVNTTSNGNHEHNAGNSANEGGSTFYANRGGAGALSRDANLIDAAGAHVHSVNVPAFAGNSGSVGGGQPVNIMPPYVTALPLIKT